MHWRQAFEIENILICIGEGRVGILGGSDARSAEAVRGDMFTVTGETQYWLEGQLHIGGTFIRTPGYSDRGVGPVEDSKGVMFGVLKEQVGRQADNKFWATWVVQGE